MQSQSPSDLFLSARDGEINSFVGELWRDVDGPLPSFRENLRDKA
jgi:hypothetical protein